MWWVEAMDLVWELGTGVGVDGWDNGIWAEYDGQWDVFSLFEFEDGSVGIVVGELDEVFVSRQGEMRSVPIASAPKVLRLLLDVGKEYVCRRLYWKGGVFCCEEEWLKSDEYGKEFS